MKEKKVSIVRSIRVEETRYNQLLKSVENSGKNFNEYVLDKIFNSKEIERDVIVEKLAEVPVQKTSVTGMKSGKVYTFKNTDKGLVVKEPRPEGDGLLIPTKDFEVEDKVYISKV